MGDDAPTRAAALKAAFCAAACGIILAAGGCNGYLTDSSGHAPGTAAPSAPANALLSVTLSFPRRGPSSARRRPRSAGRVPADVPSGSSAVIVTVQSIDGSTTLPAGLSPTTTIPLSTAPGGNCTLATPGGGEQCTVSVPAAIGRIVYGFALIDATGRALASGNATIAVAAGTTHADAVVQLEGIVAGVALAAVPLNAGSSATVTVSLQAFDAGGGVIGGGAPFANPFSLKDSDTSGASHLTVAGATTGVTGSGPTVTITSPTDVASLVYDGSLTAPFTLVAATASGTLGSAAVTVVPSPIVTDISTTGTTPPDAGQPTLSFAGSGVVQTFTASQAGWSSTAAHGFSLTLDPASCAGPVATASSTDNRTFTITSGSPGLCMATLGGGAGTTATVWFHVTAHGR